MPKVAIFLSVLLAVSPFLAGGQAAAAKAGASGASETLPFSMFLVRAGFFLASDSAFTDVYGNGAVFGGELRIGKKKLAGWLEGNYRARTGEFSFTKEETKVNVLAVEGGALYRFLRGALSPYAGAGIGFYMYNEKSSILPEVKKSQVGFCALAGASYSLGKWFVVDGKIKYSMCKMQPADFKIDIGGFTVSLGAGVRF